MAKITIEEAKRLRSIIEQATKSLDDSMASTAPNFFPSLKEDGSLVSAGTRICWNGTLKRAAVDLWDTVGNNPDNASALWEDIAYKNGYRIIPETITAGTAFSLNEYGYWKEDLYKSLLDNNVWNPDQYATGWEKIE